MKSERALWRFTHASSLARSVDHSFSIWACASALSPRSIGKSHFLISAESGAVMIGRSAGLTDLVETLHAGSAKANTITIRILLSCNGLLLHEFFEFFVFVF